MITAIQITVGLADAQQISDHLVACDNSFIPALSSRVNIDDYSNKMITHALCIEAWHDGVLAGLLCVYCNTPGESAFITNVSVLPSFQGQGLADKMLRYAIDKVQEKGIYSLKLDVDNANLRAQSLYKKFGFFDIQVTTKTTTMLLKSRES